MNSPDTFLSNLASTADLRLVGFVPLELLSGGRYGATHAGSFLGRSAVGKVDANEHPSAAFAAAVRLADAGLAPAVLFADPVSRIVVTERVVPGTSALTVQPCPRALGHLLGRLQFLPPTPAAPPLHDFLRARLNVDTGADVALSSRETTATELMEARTLLAVLPDVSATVHGDCSRGNILQGVERLWLVDARGLNGDWLFDVAVAGWKCRYDHEQLGVLADVTGANRELVTAYGTIARAARL